MRGSEVPAGKRCLGRGRQPEEVSLLSTAATAAVVVVGEPEGSSRRVSGMINHVWQQRGRRDAVRTQRPAPPLPLHAFGLLTAISSALKSSPRGGPAEGDHVLPEPRDGSLPTPSSWSFETRET